MTQGASERRLVVMERLGHQVLDLLVGLPTLRALDHSTPSGAFVGPAHLAQMRGRPELLHVYGSGRDVATAERLWTLTEDVLGTPLPV